MRFITKSILSLSASALVIFALTSCATFVSFDDISNDNRYAQIVGSEYIIKKPFLIHGVNMDKVIGKAIHQYSITPLPGIRGREIISREKLAPGTRLKVIKVQSCSNCYLDYGPRINYQVELPSNPSFNEKPIYLGDSFGDYKGSLLEGSVIILNPEYFERVGR